MTSPLTWEACAAATLPEDQSGRMVLYEWVGG